MFPLGHACPTPKSRNNDQPWKGQDGGGGGHRRPPSGGPSPPRCGGCGAGGSSPDTAAAPTARSPGWRGGGLGKGGPHHSPHRHCLTCWLSYCTWPGRKQKAEGPWRESAQPGAKSNPGKSENQNWNKPEKSCMKAKKATLAKSPKTFAELSANFGPFPSPSC